MSSSKKGILPNVPSPQGSKAASVYSRFIPKEELENFSNWNPNVVGSDQPYPNSGVKRAGAPEAKPAAPNPAEELAQLVRSTRQQGYQDGYRDGMAALEAFKQSFANLMSNQLHVLMQSVMGQLEDLQQDMAQTLATSAVQLARQVVRSELQSRPELIAEVAQETLDALMLSARHITLRVHPNDHELVIAGAAEALAARGARVVSDSSLTPGGCLIESDLGLIDATIQARWHRAAAALGCESEWTAEEPMEESEAADDTESQWDPPAAPKLDAHEQPSLGSTDSLSDALNDAGSEEWAGGST
jgi:flagellar assembly protein FliH